MKHENNSTIESLNPAPRNESASAETDAHDAIFIENSQREAGCSFGCLTFVAAVVLIGIVMTWGVEVFFLLFLIFLISLLASVWCVRIGKPERRAAFLHDRFGWMPMLERAETRLVLPVKRAASSMSASEISRGMPSQRKSSSVSMDSTLTGKTEFGLRPEEFAGPDEFN